MGYTFARANKADLTTLKNKQEGLKVNFSAGQPSSALAGIVSGKKFLLDDNSLGAKAIIFDISSNHCELTVHYDDGDRKLIYGFTKWELAKNGKMMYKKLPFPVPGLPDVVTEVAGMATWKNANTLYLVDRPVETVNSDSLTCTFYENSVKLTLLNSVVEATRSKTSTYWKNGLTVVY
jgi:hypothetical protein